MDLILEQVWEIKKNARAVHLGRLDDTDAEGEVIEQIQDGQLKDTLWRCVDALPDRQSEVLRKRYQQDMPLAEIGKHMESPQRP